VALFTRPEKLPNEIKAAVPSGEKLMAWARHDSGLLGVTNHSLIVTAGEEVRIRPWGLTLQAKWEEPKLTLILQESLDSVPITLEWLLTDAGQVPQAIHDRVTSAVLVDQAHEVPDVGRVRFVARRYYDSVTWTSVPDNYQAAHSQLGAENVNKILSQLQASFGI
jgi:hypothetical protein